MIEELTASPGDQVLFRCSCGSKFHAKVHAAQDGGLAMFISQALFSRHEHHSKMAMRVISHDHAPSPARAVVNGDSRKVGA